MKAKNHDALVQLLLKNSALDLYQHILQDYAIEDLFALCQQKEHYRLAFRAAWTLEHILLHNPALLGIHHSEVIDLYCSTDNESSLRSISKLVMHLLRMPSIQLTEDRKERIINATYLLIEKDDCPVALLVNCWDILYLLSPKYEGLDTELQTLILFHLERNPTPASKARGYKILNQLKRNGIA
ncbi:hypothetical protein G5B30_06005 [Sphingobacterium sp. SGG-5]|uniref:hypothetical protein n=1 Tax=Sphingobacterium sp. SGG-5 TaxID=2710881 RepID=UPI0013E9D75E|nr:hypothetical protein [Sphingobacterium sp. SGG-5]NGM61472.1 hypothetical protein [Sphingobacterium sp. SGG-5]